MIGDIFPNDDPLSRDLLRLLAVDADLQAIRELEEGLLNPDDHSTSITKWQMRAFFLLKLRMGFLSNALDEIITKQYNDRMTLDAIVHSMSRKVGRAYTILRDTMRTSSSAQQVMGKFRNHVAFHYDDEATAKALAEMKSEEGTLIRNNKEHDMHCVVAHQILDRIPAGRLSSDSERERIIEQIDLIQGKLHVFTFNLLIDYIQSRHLERKMVCAQT
jgi:hypothetical protein